MNCTPVDERFAYKRVKPSGRGIADAHQGSGTTRSTLERFGTK